MFPMDNPQNGWPLLELMIWWYHYFLKHLYMVKNNKNDPTQLSWTCHLEPKIHASWGLVLVVEAKIGGKPPK